MNEIESSEKLSVNESEGHILKPPLSNQLDCSQGTKERQILHLLKTWETDHLASCQVLLYHFFPPRFYFLLKFYNLGILSFFFFSHQKISFRKVRVKVTIGDFQSGYGAV